MVERGKGRMMEEYRKNVMKALEAMLGEGYEITPQDRRDNNCPVLHGICIRKKGEAVAPVIYLEELMLYCLLEKVPPEQLPKTLLQIYRQEEISQDIADHLDEFHAMKGRVRIKVINYAANTQRLKQIPHRRFLDLAIAYYLDMEMCMEAGKLTIEIGNDLMEKWDVTEEDLYRLGMVNMSAKDSFYSDEMVGIIRKTAQTRLDEDAEKLLEEIEKEDGPDTELYIASNRKHLFGACCLLNRPFLQELAERTESNLLIYPLNVSEILIYPIEKGNKKHIDERDMTKISENAGQKDKCLSNSIYLYDRAKQEVSIYKEGAPL